MKIGIQTWGSNGDVRPLLALADGLQKAGHQVTLVVSSIDNQSYQTLCGQMRIAYRQVPEHIDFDMEDFAERSFRMHPLQWLRALLDEAFFPSEQSIYQAAQILVAENDCVIGHHFLYPLKLAALLANKPFYSVTFCHAAIPNPLLPPFGFPDLGKFINPLSWKLLDAVFNWALRRPLTRLWREAGQTPPVNMLSELLTSQQLNLVAVDPVFCRGSEHWRPFHRSCGFLNLTEDVRHWTWPDVMLAFLEDGPPPVYMTFGSLQQAVPEWSMDLFLRAVELSGRRAIIQTSSNRYPAGCRQDNVYFIGKHPHQPVFARCAAVVHHGGAGTSHAATRSGCPSVVIPFMDEQLFWARQLQVLGVAGKPLPAKTVAAEALARAIDGIVSEPCYSRQARRIGSQMQANNGVGRAIELLARQFQTAFTKENTVNILFDPIKVGDINLPNRIVMAPLTRCRASAGRVPNALMAEYYAQRAGAGLILTEATSVCPHGVGYPDTPGIWSDQQVEGWTKITQAVHEAGGRIFLQLWHVGRVSHPEYLNGELPVAPSAIAPEGFVSLLRPQREFVTPRALELDEIPGIIEAYRKGAENAKRAGFDGVEIHGANGYLLDQFLQDSTNHRNDSYGGSIENRARLLLEVTDAVISVWGAGRVGVHLAPRGDAHSMGDSNPVHTFAYVAEQLGQRGIAFIFTRESLGDDRISPLLKKRFGGVLIANEAFDRDTARQVVAAEEADAVSFGKDFIANPDLVRRLQLNLPLNPFHSDTFYGYGLQDPTLGYTDYPCWDSEPG